MNPKRDGILAAGSLGRTAALALAALVALPGAARAVDASETDPKKIMEWVEDRPQGDKMVARMSMVVADSSGRERSREVRTRALDFEGGRKQILFFEAPADVRNTALLTVDYDEGSKTDDQWLYLPSLRKSTRIASTDKSGSFMGTDLSYSDMTQQDPSDYTYKLVEANVDIDGDACWLIEARPANERTEQETGYVKTQIWVSKGKRLPLQMKAWVKEGKKLKYLKFSDVKQVEGIWIAHQISVKTVRGKETASTTVLKFSEMKLNQPDVVADDFTQRRLEAGL